MHYTGRGVLMEGIGHILKDEGGPIMFFDVPCTQLENPKSQGGHRA